MTKVTSKPQLTVPKAIADDYGITTGDKLAWVPAGDAICVILAKLQRRRGRTIKERLALFDQATERQREVIRVSREIPAESGWKPHEVERGGRGAP